MKKSITPDLLNQLSRRECEVLKLVVEGRTSREIAAMIGVKPTTIDTYRSRIMAKLQIDDVPNLVRLAKECFALFARHARTLFIKDAQGRYVFANPVAEARLRVAPGGWKGKTSDQLFPRNTAYDSPPWSKE